MTHEPNRKPRSRILGALPGDEYQRLAPALKPVSLELGQVLYRSGDSIKQVYFPDNAFVSLLTDLENGSGVEVGLIGNEGMVGVSVILGAEHSPRNATVQGAGEALVMDTGAIREAFDRGGTLQTMLLRYTHALMAQISQTAACNRLHPLDGRLCRWLLMIHDRNGANRFHLTHEFLSRMLGVRRSGVSVAAGKLESLGLIKNRRGTITILDRQGLEDYVCECYSVIAEEYARILEH